MHLQWSQNVWLNKGKSKAVPVRAMKAHFFLTSVVDESEWSDSRPGRFITGYITPRTY